ELLTAGEYKRTLTVFGENTDKGREKFVEELEDTHHLFKEFIVQHRPHVNIDEVATGEHWYASRAIEKGLVDELMTSDDYIFSKVDEADIYEIKYVEKRSIQEKLGLAVQQGFLAGLEKMWEKMIFFKSY
ncbi:MAG: S49 family peptidase, partial [Pseudomonadales bacterium]|nr:S49 family peptidase [Pseudomonadales bacterium]